MADEIYAPIIDTQMNLTDALYQVCKISNANNTLVKGFRQVTKTIMRKEAKFVMLSKTLPDNMSKIIIGLGKQFDIPIIRIESEEELGKIVGFEKIRDNEVVKSCKCGTAAIKDFVEVTEGRYFIEKALSAELK